jgi:hypothetical protein
MLATGAGCRGRPFHFYYRVAGNGDCFPTALANCLLELYDGAAADQVFRRFWSHQYAADHLCFLPLLTRYVSDLTEGSYRGRLTLLLSPGQVLQLLGAAGSELRTAAYGEMVAGRVVFGNRIELRTPAILIVATRTSHAMTYLGDDTFIDEGKVRYYPLAADRAIAQLEIARVNSP